MNNRDSINLQEFIHIKGARTNNLKNVELIIPKNKLIVVTGVSGSGKSSLIMDTLYAEGQRRYVESMSSYARQFLGRMKKPDVDYIKGIAPAIAIEQKVSSSNARSTVGSLTEVYDYLRLLYARAGVTISPVSNQPVKKHQVSDVVDHILSFETGSKVMLLIPLNSFDTSRTLIKELELLLQKGFTRLLYKGALQDMQTFLESEEAILDQEIRDIKEKIYILIDRFVVNDEEENRKRISDSVNSAFYEGGGECLAQVIDGVECFFNNRFELDGMIFLEPSPQLFNYNNPYGACHSCEGYGQVLGIDPKKVVPDNKQSVYGGAVACWKGEKHGLWLDRFLYHADSVNFPIHRPYHELSPAEINILWKGTDDIMGIDSFFEELQQKSYKIQNRVTIARYRGRTVCPSCNGGRLRKEAGYVKIGDKSISELIDLPIDKLKSFFNELELTDIQKDISKRILFEIHTRLEVMCNIGLSYLSLDRQAASLSGGETQRINLTRTLGSNLTSSMYILDEPSIGLHPKDTSKLVKVLKELRDLGNTVIVVEHEEEVIKNADYLIDVGPHAGIYGGEIVFQGPYKDLKNCSERSLTLQYLTGKKRIDKPLLSRQMVNRIIVRGASQHNLKNIDVTIPLNAISVISGVSGSGKTSLVKHIIYPALLKILQISHPSKIGQFSSMEGDLDMITGVEMINQNPIGRSSRSNPVTYVKAYDDIRKLMIRQQLSKIRGLKASHFSFNTEGGRCENCKGDGSITIEMQFLADVKLVCEDCGGMRFKPEILEVKYQGKNIYDILQMSVAESLSFFKGNRAIINKIKPLDDVGLGYVRLGQPSSTLSGGEAQRVKLASFLGKDSADHQLFIFDEPTTGLHFDDIKKLLGAFQALIEKGNTVLIVEHNLEIIKSADWVIDLGPEGGDKGGQLLYQGPPNGLMSEPKSYTGQFLAQKMESEMALS